MSEKFYVEIIAVGKNSWYKNKLGKVVEARDYNEFYYLYGDTERALDKNHCKVVDEDALQNGGVSFEN